MHNLTYEYFLYVIYIFLKFSSMFSLKVVEWEAEALEEEADYGEGEVVEVEEVVAGAPRRCLLQKNWMLN